MVAPWQAPLGLARFAITTATVVPRRALTMAGDLVHLVDELSGSAARIERLLDVVDTVPPRVIAVLDEVEEVLGQIQPVVPRVERVLVTVEAIPPRVDELIGQIGQVPPKVDALLAEIGDVPPQVQALLDRVGAITPQVEALLGTVAEIVDAVRPVLTAATKHTKGAGIAIGHVQKLIDEADPILSAAVQIDPRVIDSIVPVLQNAEVVLAQTVKLDAVASLEGLVPVVERLSVVVDNLNEQVVEVGALLGGIPGAARLLKRGDARKAIEHR